MKKIYLWLIVGVFIVIAGCTKTKIRDAGDFTLTIEPSEKYAGIVKLLDQKTIFESEENEETVFEHIAEELNTFLALPYDIDIIFTECETVNAFYDNETKEIVMCYELVDAFRESFENITKTPEELNDATMHSTIFIFFHEFAHAMIDVLQLTTTGREEDAGDQLSTLILMRAGDQGEHAILDASKYFLQKQEKELKQSYLWDEHSLNAQRLYNLLCWVYGRNPEKYSYLLEQNVLPKRRAMFCPEDFKRMHRSWDALLDPYLKVKDEKIDAD